VTCPIADELRAAYHELTPATRKVADYLIDNWIEAVHLSAEEVGDRAGSSQSATARLAYALGYSSFTELRQHLQDTLQQQLRRAPRVQDLADQSTAELMQSVVASDRENLRQILDNNGIEGVKEVARLLSEAGRIAIVGARNSGAVGLLLWMHLNEIRTDVDNLVVNLHNPFDLIKSYGEDDVVVALSFPRYSKETTQVVDFARGRGSSVVAVTDRVFSPVGRAADMCLTVGVDSPGYFNSHVATVSLVNILIVLISAVFRKGESAEYLEDIDRVFTTYDMLSDTDDFSEGGNSSV